MQSACTKLDRHSRLSADYEHLVHVPCDVSCAHGRMQGWGQASDLSKDNNRILPEPPADLRTDGSTGSASKGSPTATGLSTSDVVTLALFYLSLPLVSMQRLCPHAAMQG